MPSQNGTSPKPISIRAVFFDLDGTLRHDSPASSQIFFDSAVKLGAPDLPTNRVQALRWAHAYWANHDELAEQDFTQYAGSTPEFWRNYAFRYLTAYGCDQEQALALAPQVHAHMSEHFKPENTLAPDAHITLSRLRDEGYTLGLITNRSRPVQEEMETLGIAHYFDLILAAGEVQSFKPAPEIFDHALNRVGVQPQASLYVGDNYYADIVGAARVGMIPVLLDPDRVFPEADCAVVNSLAEIHSLLA